MRMHNGNFSQWIERLSYLVSTMTTNELAMWAGKERRHQQSQNWPFSPDIFQSQQQKQFLKIILALLSRWMQMRFNNVLHWGWY